VGEAVRSRAGVGRSGNRGEIARRWSMIPKSGNRFSDKIMLKRKS
jgi:hypothetical protein